jgi:hypothetical protein
MRSVRRIRLIREKLHKLRPKKAGFLQNSAESPVFVGFTGFTPQTNHGQWPQRQLSPLNYRESPNEQG